LKPDPHPTGTDRRGRARGLKRGIETDSSDPLKSRHMLLKKPRSYKSWKEISLSKSFKTPVATQFLFAPAAVAKEAKRVRPTFGP